MCAVHGQRGTGAGARAGAACRRPAWRRGGVACRRPARCRGGVACRGRAALHRRACRGGPRVGGRRLGWVRSQVGWVRSRAGWVRSRVGLGAVAGWAGCGRGRAGCGRGWAGCGRGWAGCGRGWAGCGRGAGRWPGLNLRSSRGTLLRTRNAACAGLGRGCAGVVPGCRRSRGRAGGWLCAAAAVLEPGDDGTACLAAHGRSSCGHRSVRRPCGAGAGVRGLDRCRLRTGAAAGGIAGSCWPGEVGLGSGPLRRAGRVRRPETAGPLACGPAACMRGHGMGHAWYRRIGGHVGRAHGGARPRRGVPRRPAAPSGSLGACRVRRRGGSACLLVGLHRLRAGAGVAAGCGGERGRQVRGASRVRQRRGPGGPARVERGSWMRRGVVLGRLRLIDGLAGARRAWRVSGHAQAGVRASRRRRAVPRGRRDRLNRDRIPDRRRLPRGRLPGAGCPGAGCTPPGCPGAGCLGAGCTGTGLPTGPRLAWARCVIAAGGRLARVRSGLGLGRARRARRTAWMPCAVLAGLERRGGSVVRRRRAAAGAGCLAVRCGTVEAVQVIVLHQLDELRAVRRVGRIDAGQRCRERIRVPALCHGTRVVAAACQEPAVGVDALRDALVDLERRGEVHELTIDDLLRRLHVAAGRTGSLDPEQVVVVGRQDALAPAGLVDGLGDGDGGRYTVLALSGHGASRDLLDEGVLGGGAGLRCARWRHVMPVVRGQCAGIAADGACVPP